MKYMLHLLCVLVASVSLANVIRVPEDSPNLPLAIQNAINGDTLDIAPSTYYIDQQIVIDKSITLIGRSSSNRAVLISISANHMFDTIDSGLPNEFHFTLANLSCKSESNRMIFNIYDIEDLTIKNCEFINTPCFGAVSGSHILIENSKLESLTGSPYGNTLSLSGSQFSQSQLAINNCSFNNVCNINFGGNIAPTISISRCTFSNIRSNWALTIMGSGTISNCSFIDSGYSGYNTNGTFISITGIVLITDCIFHNIVLSSQGMSHPCFIACYGDVATGEVTLDYCADIPYYWNGLCESEYGSQINLLSHNIYSDPQINDDFSLRPTSPCIDAGDPNSPLDPDGTRADIGAYYFCQGEGIRLPDVLRVSAEPGYPEQLTATLQTTCDPVQIDSAKTTTGLFTLNSYPTQIAQDYSNGTFHLTFNPTQQGLYADTLHIWANTDPPHHIVPLVGEAGHIPGPVTDLSIQILPDQSAQLTWSPVTQTIYGNPVVPDYYLVYYSELPPDQDTYFYLTATPGAVFTHFLVARFAPQMFYRVVAYKGINPSTLGIEPGMPWPEVQQRLAREER
jgi:hypothetical protein